VARIHEASAATPDNNRGLKRSFSGKQNRKMWVMISDTELGGIWGQARSAAFQIGRPLGVQQLA
jgi:hypothetical protein